MYPPRRAAVDGDYLSNSLSQLYILADDKISPVIRRCLIRNGDDDLLLSLKEIFLNLASGSLQLDDPRQRELVGRSTIGVAEKIVSPKRPSGVRVAILRSGATCLRAFALVLPLVLDQIEDQLEGGEWPKEADSERQRPSTSGLQTPPLPKKTEDDIAVQTPLSEST